MNISLRISDLLRGGGVVWFHQEVMDLSYDMLATPETNAILVTNRNDDTCPGWILIKIVGKPDLSIFHLQ